MAKIILHGKEARERIKAGIDKTADTVRMTLGPKGRNAIIHSDLSYPLVTNDGVTIARHIFLKEPFEEMGAQLIRQVAWNSDDRAGDGTTTATVLAQHIATEGMKAVDAKEVNPMVLKRQLEKATKEVVAFIRSLSKPVETEEEIARVGAISSQDEEVGKLIAELYTRLGKEAVITIEQGNSYGCSAKVTEGFELDRGFVSPIMATDINLLNIELVDPYIVICDYTIASPVELSGLVNLMAKNNKSECILFCNELAGEAFKQVIKSKIEGHFKLVAVHAPGVGENQSKVLQDIATITGAKYFSRELGERIDKITEDQVGSCKRAIVGRGYSRIIQGAGKPDDVSARAKAIKKSIEETEDQFVKITLTERLERFNSGVGVVKIGAASETELKEKLYRVEDAINATKHAIKEGVVPGGGIALLRAIKSVTGNTVGDRIIRSACGAPFAQILFNTGIEGKEASDIVNQITSEESAISMGFNAESEKVEDLYESGVIDPTRVVVSEIENATSVANTLLTVESAICEEEGRELGLEEIKKDLLS